MATTFKDRYSEAKQVAGATATNKAALANKAAKQSAALANTSKMTQALLGAQAANDAVANGYDEGLSEGANMASTVASENQRESELAQNQKQFEASQAQAVSEAVKNREHESEENKKNRIWSAASTIASSLFKL